MKNEPPIAATIGAKVCAHGTVHVLLYDGDGQIIASASMPSETGLELADQIRDQVRAWVGAPVGREPSEVANAACAAALHALTEPFLEAKLPNRHFMVALESLVTGAFLMAVNLGGDDVVLDTLFERVKERLAEQRLSGLAPAGSA